MPAASIKITIANITDAPMLRQLSEQTFRESFGPDNKPEDMDKYVAEELGLAKLSGEIENKHNVFFIASYADAVAGYAKVSVLETPEGLACAKPLEISRLYVHKGYQNRKTGAALLQHCLDHAAQNHHDVVWLGVWEHNPGAIRFYERMGFELFGSHGFRLGNDDQTDLLMKKEIQAIGATP